MGYMKLKICMLLAIAAGIILANPAPRNTFFQTTSTKKKILNVGRAPYNLTSPKFNCRAFLSSVDDLEELHIAFLYNTFGNKFDCLKTLLYDPRLKTLEVHLINEPGHRNNRLGRYEFLYRYGESEYEDLLEKRNRKLRKRFKRYIRKIKRVLDEHRQPYTKLLISPGLESNVNERAGKTLVRWTRKNFPKAKVVWNPLYPTGRANADYLEQHTKRPLAFPPCIVDLDGTDISFKRRVSWVKRAGDNNYIEAGPELQRYIEKYSKKCEVVFLWVMEDNGIADSRFVDPRKRNHRNKKKIYDLIARQIKIANRTK